MSKQNILKKIIIDLEDLAEEVRSIETSEKIKDAIMILNDTRIYGVDTKKRKNPLGIKE